MYPLSKEMHLRINEEAIYNLYLYLAHLSVPDEQKTLQRIVFELEDARNKHRPKIWRERDIHRLRILKNAVHAHPTLAYSRLYAWTLSKDGLNACAFTRPNGDISFIFAGTAKGEWIDNGEGLSGIPEENTYLTYDSTGNVLSRKVLQNDYATDQQVEALNWFHKIAAKNGWTAEKHITVSGHSKGGNKAQFITMHSDLVDVCYNFHGHGFSPEALTALKKQYGNRYETRRQKLIGIASENDYVHIWGKQLVPQHLQYYFRSRAGIHLIETLLSDTGNLLPQCEQGKLARYLASASESLMQIDAAYRQSITLGVMNLCQKYLGEGTPVNGDSVSVETTIAGLMLGINHLFLHEVQ